MYYHKQNLAEGPLGLPREALKRALAETLKIVLTFAWTASELLLLSVLASNTAFAPVAQLYKSMYGFRRGSYPQIR